MIELRWLEYEEMQFDDVCSPIGQVRTKLQYRQMLNPIEIEFQEPIWSEWQDVPTETEEDDR